MRCRGGGPDSSSSDSDDPPIVILLGILLLIVGTKTFYISKPETWNGREGTGEEWERRDISPMDCRTSDPTAWLKVVPRPGDLFYLPKAWWHFVVSEPQCVMTNVWL